MIALTLDDGPNVPYTHQILDILDEFQVKATFFLLGKWVKEAPRLARQVYQRGHEIGSHTLSHPALPQLPAVHGHEEIVAGKRAVFAATGQLPTVFRAPFGNIPEWKLPMPSVGWDVHGSDWVTQNPDFICNPIFEYLDKHDDAIVLLHDGYYRVFGQDRSGTVEAVRRILERYPRERFCTVSARTTQTA